MYAAYTNTITLTVMALNKSVDCRCTLKATESCMIYLDSFTISDDVELCKHIIQDLN